MNTQAMATGMATIATNQKTQWYEVYCTRTAPMKSPSTARVSLLFARLRKTPATYHFQQSRSLQTHRSPEPVQAVPGKHAPKA